MLKIHNQLDSHQLDNPHDPAMLPNDPPPHWTMHSAMPVATHRPSRLCIVSCRATHGPLTLKTTHSTMPGYLQLQTAWTTPSTMPGYIPLVHTLWATHSTLSGYLDPLDYTQYNAGLQRDPLGHTQHCARLPTDLPGPLPVPCQAIHRPSGPRIVPCQGYPLTLKTTHSNMPGYLQTTQPLTVPCLATQPRDPLGYIIIVLCQAAYRPSRPPPIPCQATYTPPHIVPCQASYRPSRSCIVPCQGCLQTLQTIPSIIPGYIDSLQATHNTMPGYLQTFQITPSTMPGYPQPSRPHSTMPGKLQTLQVMHSTMPSCLHTHRPFPVPCQATHNPLGHTVLYQASCKPSRLHIVPCRASYRPRRPTTPSITTGNPQTIQTTYNTMPGYLRTLQTTRSPMPGWLQTLLTTHSTSTMSGYPLTPKPPIIPISGVKYSQLCVDESATATFKTIETFGRLQYQLFVEEVLVDSSKFQLVRLLKQNSLPLISCPKVKAKPGKNPLFVAKSDAQIYSVICTLRTNFEMAIQQFSFHMKTGFIPQHCPNMKSCGKVPSLTHLNVSTCVTNGIHQLCSIAKFLMVQHQSICCLPSE